ncbi:MAG: hypothetical protein WBO10_04165 [Pyrinomonadaceae bacterium]
MKKIFATLTLAATMMFGATFANADGIIILDKADGQCNTKDGIIILDRTEGILVSDFASGVVFGIQAAFEGILVSDKLTPCTETKKDGIIILDRTEGILVSD